MQSPLPNPPNRLVKPQTWSVHAWSAHVAPQQSLLRKKVRTVPYQACPPEKAINLRPQRNPGPFRKVPPKKLLWKLRHPPGPPPPLRPPPPSRRFLLVCTGWLNRSGRCKSPNRHPNRSLKRRKFPSNLSRKLRTTNLLSLRHRRFVAKRLWGIPFWTLPVGSEEGTRTQLKRIKTLNRSAKRR